MYGLIELEMTSKIVSAYVSNNVISPSELVASIAITHAAIAKLRSKNIVVAPVPAVPIKTSVTSEFLISLEDGRHYKSLKRHLGNRGMTPTDYRTKWGLPYDYPMVAPEYTKRRSALAKSIGLGRRDVARTV